MGRGRGRGRGRGAAGAGRVGGFEHGTTMKFGLAITSGTSSITKLGFTRVCGTS